MRVLAVVPARGGSKGLPGKNLALLGGVPLIGHALRFTALCPELTRTVVSTDSEEIASVAREHGGDVPFLRPEEISRDETSIWPVLKHALDAVDPDGDRYDLLLLVSPASPFRLPADLAAMVDWLAAERAADGIVAASDAGFDPLWLCVVERNGRMEHAFPEAKAYGRRQDAPRALKLNGALHLFRTDFVRNEPQHWFNGSIGLYEMPRSRVVDIDEAFDLDLAAQMLAGGLVELPWLA